MNKIHQKSGDIEDELSQGRNSRASGSTSNKLQVNPAVDPLEQPAQQQTIDINNENNNSTEQNKIGEKKLEEEQEKLSWQQKLLKIVIVLVIVGILAYSIIEKDKVSDLLTDFVEWIEENPEGGIILLILAYIAATVFFFPGSILTIGAGFVLFQSFKKVWLAILVGSVAVWIGAEIGSILAMILGRYVFRDILKKKAQKYRYFNAIDKVVEKDGFKLVFFLRITPVIPFNFFNYAMGITGVKIKDYALGGLGMIPGTIMFVSIGTTLSNVADLASGNYSGGIAFIILLIVGTLLGLGVLIYIGALTKKELKKYIDIDEPNKDGSKNDIENENKQNSNNQNNQSDDTNQNSDQRKKQNSQN